MLILAFPPGLSATYQSSAIAVEELAAKYPERKIYTVDTLCASLGQGLLVWYAVQEKNKGGSTRRFGTGRRPMFNLLLVYRG